MGAYSDSDSQSSNSGYQESPPSPRFDKVGRKDSEPLPLASLSGMGHPSLSSKQSKQIVKCISYCCIYCYIIYIGYSKCFTVGELYFTTPKYFTKLLLKLSWANTYCLYLLQHARWLCTQCNKQRVYIALFWCFRCFFFCFVFCLHFTHFVYFVSDRKEEGASVPVPVWDAGDTRDAQLHLVGAVS